MNRLMFTLAFLGFVCLMFAPATAAEELAADDYIEFWKPLAGVWKGIVVSGEKSIDTLWRARLAPNGKCFVTYATGDDIPALQTIDGYDPVTKKWTVVGFDADGTFSIDAFQLNDMQKGKRLGEGLIGSGEVKRFTHDGKETTTTYTLSCKEFSNNRVVLVWSNRNENGQPVPDRKWTGERQLERQRRPQIPPSTPPLDSEEITAADYVEFWKPLLGSWEDVEEFGDKKIECTWRLRLSRHNKCLLTSAESEGKPTGQTIDGYDPGTGKWTFAGFDADGSFRLATIEFSDMKKGKRLDKGVIGIFEMKVSSNDGKLTTSSSVMSCTEFAEDRIVLTWSDAKEDGKPVPDGKTVLERLPERSRRTRR